MQFYKFEGVIKEDLKKTEELQDNSRIINYRNRKIALKSDEFSEKLQNRAYFFISNIVNGTAMGGIIMQDTISIERQLATYLNTVDIVLTEYNWKEITFHTLLNMLFAADRDHFVNDDDEILEQFELNRLYKFHGRGLDFNEKILVNRDKTSVYDTAKRFFCEDTVISELDRIYVGGQNSFITGHPVHYMIETDGCDVRNEVSQILLSALYENNRIYNKRYSLIEINPHSNATAGFYKTLYKSNFGGAIIVRYIADDHGEDVYANCGRDNIQLICETMKKYRNNVLTVFCLPRECTKIKEIFYEQLLNMSFVELREDLISSEKAADFLKMLSKEKKIQTDTELFEKLQEEKKYLASELHKLFDEWYDKKLKTDIFPQYKELSAVNCKVAKTAPKGSDYDELMNMVGLSDAKQVINQALNYFKAQKLFANKGMKIDKPAMHMVFTGNPGTAKTTVARLFAGIMKENGLLSSGHLIETGRGDLVKKYVGWTAPAIQAKFNEAKGGVLFIDEAYSLVDDRDGSFGDEAINTIVQEMENHRADMIVIFAGYPDEMKIFLQKNPGLRSRIAFHVPFADYDADELCSIAKLIAEKKGISIHSGAYEKLQLIFEQIRHEPDFGNGRYVRNLIEQAKMAQAERLLAMDFDEVTEKDVVTLCAEDIKMLKIVRPVKRKIGFVA